MPLSNGDFGGDLRRSLEAQRDDLVAKINDCPADKAAPLHRQLTMVLEKIDKLPNAKEVSKLDQLADGVADELAARRRARAAGDAGSAGG